VAGSTKSANADQLASDPALTSAERQQKKKHKEPVDSNGAPNLERTKNKSAAVPIADASAVKRGKGKIAGAEAISSSSPPKHRNAAVGEPVADSATTTNSSKPHKRKRKDRAPSEADIAVHMDEIKRHNKHRRDKTDAEEAALIERKEHRKKHRPAVPSSAAETEPSDATAGHSKKKKKKNKKRLSQAGGVSLS